jgi:hypothetical protein
LNIDLDGSRQEQRIPLQVLNVQPQSVVWGRTDGSVLPPNVYQDGNDLVIRNPSPEKAGNYICTITHPDGNVEYINVQLNYPSGQPGGRPQPHTGGPPRVSIQPQVINLKEGQRMIVQYSVASHEPINVVWNKLIDGVYQPIPSLFTVEPNRLVLNSATPDAAGNYQVVVSNLHGVEKQQLTINVTPRRIRQRGQPNINLPQNQYEVGPGQTIDIIPTIAGQIGATITWTKDGSTNLPDGVLARSDGYLRIEGRSSDVAGQYNLDVSNSFGQTAKTIYVQWKESSFNRFYRYQRARI